MSEELKDLLGDNASSLEESQEFVDAVVALSGGKVGVLVAAVMAKLSSPKAAAKKKPAAKKKAK